MNFWLATSEKLVPKLAQYRSMLLIRTRYDHYTDLSTATLVSVPFGNTSLSKLIEDTTSWLILTPETCHSNRYLDILAVTAYGFWFQEGQQVVSAASSRTEENLGMFWICPRMSLCSASFCKPGFTILDRIRQILI